jgi:hypothetical protein
MKNVDPNGPCPMEYWAAIEWQAIRNGKPPVIMNGVYNIPTDYHERMKQEKKYENLQRKTHVC